MVQGMYCVVNLFDRYGTTNTVTIMLDEVDHDANKVYDMLAKECDGLTITNATIVAVVNGKLVGYTMRKTKEGVKVFNKHPLKV